MIIVDSSIQFSSAHKASVKEEKMESLLVQRPGRDIRSFSQAESSSLELKGSFASAFKESDLLNAAKSLRAGIFTESTLFDAEAKVTLDDTQSLKFSIVSMLVERMTGRKMQLFTPSNLQIDQSNTEMQQNTIPEQQFGAVYESHSRYQESESTSFSAQGLIHTADGKEIKIDVALNMSREFVSESGMSVRIGAALKDPLVINFDGNAVDVTEQKYSFDIDAGGIADQISFVGPSSGFLVLDKNNDGQINDGSELFGALSGDGFADLSKYDEDGNQWIDEADSIFDRLQVWTKDAEGNDQLMALSDKDIGAIYLGHESTSFQIKDANNQLEAQVRETGIFLKESGGVGTVQQIDLVV